jgi:hypothetical protein
MSYNSVLVILYFGCLISKPAVAYPYTTLSAPGVPSQAGTVARRDRVVSYLGELWTSNRRKRDIVFEAPKDSGFEPVLPEAGFFVFG